MLEKLTFKRYLRYIPLFLVMLMSMLVITAPKTYAWTGYYSDFAPYVNDVNKGEIIEKLQDPMETTTVRITHGPATGLEFEFIGSTDKDDPGFGDFTWDSTHIYSVGDKVFWNIQTQLWELDTLDLQPVFNGETAFITSVDAPLTVDEILARIKAIDNEDGDISHLIQVEEDAYTVSMHTVGTHYINFVVYDSAGNEATLMVHVVVRDVAVPVITGVKTYNQSYTTKKDVGTILAALSATDNYDTTVPVKVKTDNYTANFNKVGSYQIIFNATDVSGNEGLYTVTVNVIDDVKPVFSGPTVIAKGQSSTLLLADILSQITVSDVVDQNVSFTVKSDGYTGFGNKVGDWPIVLEAIDSSGNVATHTVTIQVRDNIPPVFYVDNFFIHVDDVVSLTRQDIIDLLVATGQLTLDPQGLTTFTFPMNEYEGNETTPGIYGLTVLSTHPSGTSRQVSLAIQVNETVDDPGAIIVEPDEGFFSTVWNYIKDGWNWLKSPVNETSKFYNGYYILIGIGVIVGIGVFAPNIKKGKKFRFKKSFKRNKYRRY